MTLTAPLSTSYAVLGVEEIAPYAELLNEPFWVTVPTDHFRKKDKANNECFKVPDPGLTLPDGSFIPTGNIVGLNPSVMMLDHNVYGPDTDVFRPERWLQWCNEDAEGYANRPRRMDELNTFVWGGGNRTSLGRFLAKTSLYKVTAMLISRYDLVLEDPTKEWELHRNWMVYNDKIKVKIVRRNVSVKE